MIHLKKLSIETLLGFHAVDDSKVMDFELTIDAVFVEGVHCDRNVAGLHEKERIGKRLIFASAHQPEVDPIQEKLNL